MKMTQTPYVVTVEYNLPTDLLPTGAQRAVEYDLDPVPLIYWAEASRSDGGCVVDVSFIVMAHHEEEASANVEAALLKSRVWFPWLLTDVSPQDLSL